LTYLKDKGYSAQEIKSLWDRDAKAGHGSQTSNKNGKEMQAHFAGVRKAMTGAKT
jgi:hypothetical protein